MDPREAAFSLSSFLNELVLAWQKLAIYQEWHPAREQAISRAHAVLVRLIAPTGSLALGVSRDAIIGPEEKLTSGPAVRLATALYLREVAVLRFEDGIQPDELEQLLILLPRGATNREFQPLATELAEAGVCHVLVEPVDFSALVVTETLDKVESALPQESLWDRILQRLLSDQRLAAVSAVVPEAGQGSMGEVMAVIASLLERYGATAGATPEPGASLTPAEALAALAGLVGGAVGAQVLEASGPEAQGSAVRHFTELIGALPEGLREGVLDAAVRELAGSDEGAPALRSLSGAVSSAQLLGALRRLRAERATFSPRALSLLESLVVEAAAAPRDAERPLDPSDLAQQLRRVFTDEDVDRAGLGLGADDRFFLDLRHNVPSHARFADLEPYLESLGEQRLSVALATTLIDLLQRPLFDAEQTGWIIGRMQAVHRELLADARFATARRIIESLRELAASPERTRQIRTTAERCLEALSQSESLAAVVDAFRAAEPAAVESLREMIGLLGRQAVDQLLQDLGEENDLSRRRHIFDLLVALGPAIAPAATALVTDSRWYMRRNMLSLLRQVGQGIGLEVVRSSLEHPDARVRLEAIKCLPEVAAEVSEETVGRLILDPDSRVAEAAVTTLGRARIAAAVEPLVGLLRRADPFAAHKQLRVRAVQALAEIGDPSVLPRISHCFRGWFAVVSTEERHVAYETLELYPESARRPWLKKGQLSPDAKVREICRRLATTDAEAGGEVSG